jgi:ATP-dependent Clp protease ATP-binding subunit ClpC
MIQADIFNKFTKHLKNALKIAGFLAKQETAQAVEPIHLLQGILRQPGSLAAEILHKNGFTYSPTNQQELSSIKTVTLDLSQGAQKIITKMLNVAFEYHHLYVGTEHLLMALLQNQDESIIFLLKEKNISRKKLIEHLEVVLSSTSNFSELTDIFSELFQAPTPDTRMFEQKSRQNEKNILDLFATDLTDTRSQATIDPVIGRDKEIERLIQILSRRHKNNPLLLGDPGVGKTAIVEGLAKKIISGQVPEVLKNKKILNLDLGLMLAGTMYRGEFESRLKNILDEIKQNPNIIIFIDELHNIIGAGSTTGGTMDAANLIKPSLARGEIRCIGATTHAEYRKYIESDPALERRFQVINVNEPSRDESIAILQGLKQYYENFHQVQIENEALTTAVDLAIRYIPEKFLPDKAIDLIDEASSRAKINHPTTPLQKKLFSLKEKIKEAEHKKNIAITEEDYDQALLAKQTEQELKKYYLATEKKLEQKPPRKSQITPTQIATVVAQITNIPLHYLENTGDAHVTKLEQKINKQLIGQTEAIQAVCSILKRAQLGLTQETKPIGSFLFLGPSGVGKTELAKIIAREYFGSIESLIKIDMSEFTESFNISKLIGAPAGYVGYKEGGKITDAVRRKPYSVILFDEIEKGHPDVFNLLLQILDEGNLTDAEGRKVNFRHTIIILTSNLASEKFNSLGSFGFNKDKTTQKYSPTQIKTQVLQELEQEFKPELLNRLDNIVVFNALSAKDIRKITELQLVEITNQLKNKGIILNVTSAVLSLITNLQAGNHKGAREIKRNLENLIKQPLAEKLLLSTKKKFSAIVRNQKIIIE